MVDLDSLAEKRATALKQEVQAWRDVLWGREFQALTHSMSDGEIENLLMLCLTVVELKAVIRYAHLKNAGATESVLDVLQRAAESAGLNMRAWIESLVIH